MLPNRITSHGNFPGWYFLFNPKERNMFYENPNDENFQDRASFCAHDQRVPKYK